MGSNEMTSKTNPRLSRILKKYVNADGIGAEKIGVGSGQDWYNMTCPRCPWVFDGEKHGLYANVSGGSADAPDYTPAVRKDADGDSGRVAGDDTPACAASNGDEVAWDSDIHGNNDLIGRKESPWGDPLTVDELLDGVDASIDADEEKSWVDTDGVDADGVVRRMPIVRYERPETQECPGESFCVRLMVASDLIKQQAAIAKMQDELLSGLSPCTGVGDNSNQRKLTQREKRSLKLRRASKRRGR